ncbi:nucleoside triphosphate hydrolase protein [Wolfiporia cocos MD-104 SS10]|uniref:Ribosome assembly protein 1 n=1 Tax=Wolfiporia cocos (strain MD-104) TaxID=742152 RepID=A0A2H3JMX1_WOLCO|nr:nucleoside triphosphate hydrolase protein [Wolfiporia cocos MD-104 SS10]
MSLVPEAVDVRNVTTIGHVDHGKTTMMDALLAANNIISTRMAGKIRYLDSREDEQQRGITMESSAVSLRFKVMERSADGGSLQKTYVVNMIDTPGHVDFSSEVSTASRLCDGALVLVDVVEGVCTQTITVLRQAWQDRLQPVLVINKFDRLITELKLTPVEAYQHLSQLIEQVNAVMGSFFASERMEDDLRWREERERRLAEKKESHADEVDATIHDADEFQEKDDEDIYFAPERGNVVFASAINGWGFRIGKFAHIYAVKLGIKEAKLRTVLWGDFYLDPKTKRVISHKHLRGRNLKPLFVQFILDNIWAVYDAVIMNPNPDKVTKIVSTLNLKIPPRDLQSRDSKQLLSSIFSQWLSLSSCIIQTIVDIVPSPSAAQRVRIPKMLYPDLFESTIEPKNKLEEHLYSCDASPAAHVTAFVSKMFAVPSKELPENKKKPMTVDEMRSRARAAREARDAAKAASEAGASTPAESEPASTPLEEALEQLEVKDDTNAIVEADETLLGFARIYSGTIRVGTTIACVLPKYHGVVDPTHPRNAPYVVTTRVEALYVMMGRELVPVELVQAGNVFAIQGLEGKVWRSATLCAPCEEGLGDSSISTSAKEWLLNLGGVIRYAAPIVRVALEPESPADMPKLVRGLKLLSQADPCVETFQQQTGEHVILTAGELHLERCLKDLRERFAMIELNASKPIVPFRETAVKPVDMSLYKAPNVKRGTIESNTSNNLIKFTVRARPLPKKLSEFLQENLATLKRMEHEQGTNRAEEESLEEEEEDYDVQGEIIKKPSIRPEEFWKALHEACRSVGSEWTDIAEKIWAFGPQRVGSCLLIDARPDTPPASLKRRHERNKAGESESTKDKEPFLRDLDNHLEAGFQLATLQGPLCAEPVEGLAYFVESVEIDREGIEQERLSSRMPQVTGAFITAVREACRNGLLEWSPRLMLAMYTCDIQASTDVLGKVYGVVAKRRGRIVSEEMKEGTEFFTVRALLPVVESFGFADDIRKRTSGAASPQLIFSGYEMLDLDPFWVPKTEEELEDLGDKADRSNIAKEYMDAVRERKGMRVDRKIVEFAEKQRTLKR